MLFYCHKCPFFDYKVPFYGCKTTCFTLRENISFTLKDDPLLILLLLVMAVRIISYGCNLGFSSSGESLVNMLTGGA